MVIHKVLEVYCHRCNVKVYPVDKIGPLKGAHFHHQCFKCRFCGLSLNMKNFIQNQLDPDDKEVYCNNHVPKSLAGHVGGDAIGIRSALSAPRKGQSYNEQIRGSDKYNPDMHGVEIQNALLNFKFFRDQDNQTKNEMNDIVQGNDKYMKDNVHQESKDYNSKLSNSYGNGHVANGYSDQVAKSYSQYNSNSPDVTQFAKVGNDNNNIQNGKTYSPTINNFLSQTNSIKTGSLSPLDDIMDYESQIDLERRLRQEEDEMYATFARKRKQEEGLIETRFRDEFHMALQELRNKFEGNSPSPPQQNNPPSVQGYVKKKLHGNSGPAGAVGSSKKMNGSGVGKELLEKEERDLERRLTVKRDREKDALSRALMEYERGVAHDLIDRHASEMLKFTTLRARGDRKRGAILPLTSSTFVTSPIMSSQVTPPVASQEDTPSSSRLTYYRDNRSDGEGSERSRYLAYDYVEAKNDGTDPLNSSAHKSCTTPSTYASDITSNKNTTTQNGYGNLQKNSYNFSTEPPSPRPPKCPKSQIYNDPSIFEELDQRAINIANKNQNTFTDLVRQLTRHCATDVQKARTLFRWITIKNLNNMTFDDDVKLDTPMGLLRGIKLGTESYHMLFKRLCSYAGLHCVVIRGYSKSAGYLPGMKFEEDKRFRNTWNAAFLDGSWRFVQCNWGARHLVNAKDRDSDEVLQQQQQHSAKSTNVDTNGRATVNSVDNLRYEYDDHYFLTDPEQFIYEFFPKQPEWQLLDRSISLEEFENLPFIRSLFFKFGLQFSPSPSSSTPLSSNNNNNNNSTKNGSANANFVMPRQRAIMMADPTGAANLTLTMPSHLVSSLVFHYNLRFYDSDKDSLDSVNMRRYVMQTLVGNSVVFKVHCPCKGDFILDVFANQVNAGDYASGQPMRFKSVCKAKIISEVLEKIMIPLPDCASGEWGPIKAYKLFGMIPASHEDSVINTGSPRFAIRFRLSPSRRLIDFVAALHKNGYDGDRDKEKVLSKSVVPRWSRERDEDEENANDASNCIAFDIALPDEGQYGLDIYAREENEPPSATYTASRGEKYVQNGDHHSSPVMMANNENRIRENKNGSVKEKHLLTHACKYLINYRLN